MAFGAKALARSLESSACFTQSSTRLMELFGQPLNSRSRAHKFVIGLLLLPKGLTELIPETLHAVGFLQHCCRKGIVTQSLIRVGGIMQLDGIAVDQYRPRSQTSTHDPAQELVSQSRVGEP